MKNPITQIGIFEYKLHPAEIAWAFVSGAAAFVMATTTAPINWQDWQSWVVALVAAGARPAVAIVFGKAPARDGK